MDFDQDPHSEVDAYYDYIRSHSRDVMLGILTHLQRNDFSTSLSQFKEMSPKGLASDLYNLYVILCVDEESPDRKEQNNSRMLSFLQGIKKQFPEADIEFPEMAENYRRFYRNVDSFIDRLSIG
jgi:hypothetical protein